LVESSAAAVVYLRSDMYTLFQGLAKTGP